MRAMADSTEWVKHIESYVKSSVAPLQQASSVDSIANLLRNDSLTIEALVREMDIYLTTTDNIIRSRGILLLGEVLFQLVSKPMNGTSIHSLVVFFSDRLADWKALSGAILGCLALLRRKGDVGTVSGSGAKAIAQSFLQNLQVQSLGQHDRKLSFQLMECLLDHYAGAIEDLGDTLLYGICEAMDEEKDPQCLVLAFRIIESLARLYPDPSGPLSKFAGDLFEILGNYFPIQFTHRKGEDDDNKREELSRALLLAFASTPLFEPFSIPLLLEKLSSSLPSAKVESLRYISYCATKYGPDRMVKYAQTLWSSVKDATYISPQSTLSVDSELMSGMSFQENDIMVQTFVLLQEIIQQDNDFVNLILSDKDIRTFVNSLNEYNGFDDIPAHVRQRLHAVGRILSVCAKSSMASCNKVFESFFQLLMDALRISPVQPFANSYLDDDCSQVKLNFGALYLCVEFLGACRSLIVPFNDFTSTPDFTHQTWCIMIGSFSELLAKQFFSLLRSNFADNAHNAYVYIGVKGLQILASFPSNFLSVSKSLYDSILLKLVSVVTSAMDRRFLWTSALKALIEIGLLFDKFPDLERALHYKITVVENVVSLISSGDSDISSTLKLKAAYDIGVTRKDFMLHVVQGLDEAISTHFSAAYEGGNIESDKLAVKLLNTYSDYVLPWLAEHGYSEEISLKLALSIWEMVENSMSINFGFPEISSNLLDASMIAMKKAVGCCTEEGQETIINKSFGVLSSNNCFESTILQSGSSMLKLNGLQNHNLDSSVCNKCLVSLFAAVVIALHPQTRIPNGKMILQLFILAMFDGEAPSAHALGSLVNKLPLRTSIINPSTSISLEDALDVIFSGFLETSCNGSTLGGDEKEVDCSSLRLNTLRLQLAKSNAVIGLAWIGKGLLMRGHVKVRDISMILLGFLMLGSDSGFSIQLLGLIEICEREDIHELMKSAGDAFHIIMRDSEECLNRRYHAAIRPLYKQRFFSTIMPIFLTLVAKSDSSMVRSMIYRAFGYVVSETPLTAILNESKLIPVILDCLSVLNKAVMDKEIIYNVLLVLSGILIDKNGQKVVTENAPRMITQLIELTTCSQSTAIRETAIQCLVAISELPHTRIYPFRTQVLRAASKALDDPKRIVRQEAVKCRHAWTSISSRNLHF